MTKGKDDAMDLKTINRNIKAVARSGEKFNLLVQVTAVACIAHCQACGDATPALRLVQAMPKSTRRGLLIDFFAAYSPIGMNVAKGKVGLHKEGSKLYRPFDVAAAEANPWYNSDAANKEDLPDTTVEVANKMIFAVASKLEKQVKEGLVPANDVPAVEERIVALRRIAAAAVKASAKTAAAPARKVA
jgi:hypothetical protein